MQIAKRRMNSIQLFLGMPIPSPSQFQRVNLSEHPFVGGDSLYLKTIDSKGTMYIGKNIGRYTDLATLLLIEVNIKSLLRTIFPEVPTVQLVLLTTEEAYDAM